MKSCSEIVVKSLALMRDGVFDVEVSAELKQPARTTSVRGYAVSGLSVSIYMEDELSERFEKNWARETLLRTATALGSAYGAVGKISPDRLWIKVALSVPNPPSPDCKGPYDMGTGIDLAVATAVFGVLVDAGILHHVHHEEFKSSLGSSVFVGELTMNGDVRPVRGMVAMAAELARRVDAGATDVRMFVSCGATNTYEAEIGARGKFHVVSVGEITEDCWEPGNPANEGSLVDPLAAIALDYSSRRDNDAYPFDMKDVIGHAEVKEALAIAVVAGLNVMLFSDAPGSGVTMLAKRLITIMPPMTLNETMVVAETRSRVGLGVDIPARSMKRPFRAPHHTVSEAGMMGIHASDYRFTASRPGELGLAAQGMLFLDELGEFRKSVLEHVAYNQRDTARTKPTMIAAAYTGHWVPGMDQSINGYTGFVRRAKAAPQDWFAGVCRHIFHVGVTVPQQDVSELTGMRSGPRKDSARYRRDVMRAQSMAAEFANRTGLSMADTSPDVRLATAIMCYYVVVMGEPPTADYVARVKDALTAWVLLKDGELPSLADLTVLTHSSSPEA